MVMQPATVSAGTLALGLGAISPFTGPAAPVIAAVALIIGIGVPLYYAIDAWKSSRGTAQVGAIRDVDSLTAQVINDPVGQEALASAGYEAIVVQAQFRLDLITRTAEALAPGTLPYFRDSGEARGWRDYLLQISGSGLMDGPTFSNALAWASVEASRLDLGVSESLQLREPTAYLELLNPPTFTSYDQAAQWLSGWEFNIDAGELSEPGISTITQHYQSEVSRLAALAIPTAPTAPSAPAAPAAPGVVTIPPELTAAIAQLTSAMAALQASGAASRAQVDAMSAQIAALTSIATMPQPRMVSDPAVTSALGGLASSLPLALGTTLPQALSAAMARGAGPNAHAAQQARYACQGSFLGSIANVVSKVGLGVIAGSVFLFDNPIKDAITDKIDTFMLKMLDPKRFAVPTTYEGAVANASERLSEAIGFGTWAQATAYAFEAMTPLKTFGFNQLAGFLGDLAGFRRIADGLMGTVENAAIYQPLRYEANRRFRPTIPDDRMLAIMFQKRSLSRSELRDYQERLGLPDLYIDRIPGFIFNDPNPSLLIRAFQIAEPGAVEFSADDRAIMKIAGIDPTDPDAYFKLKFAKSGLDDTDVKAFIPVVRMGILRREQTIRYEQINRLFRDGYIDRGRAQKEIEAARVPDDVVPYRLAALDLMREYETKEDLRQLIMAMLSRGRLDPAQATARLTDLGMDGQRVHIQVLRATLGLGPRSALPAPAPAESPDLVEVTQ